MAAWLLVAVLVGGGWLWTPDKDRAALEAVYAGPASEFVELLGVRMHVRDSAPGAVSRDSAPSAVSRDSAPSAVSRDSAPSAVSRDSAPGAVSRDGPPRAAPGTPTLLLLHGFGSSLHTWEPWAQALAATHRVIRIDLPGAGLTGADPTGDYTDERGIALVTALLDQRGVARATLVGHSMGGRLAWRYAAAQPQRVDRLVLVAPDGFASPGFEYGKAPEVGVLVKLMQVALPKAVLRWSLQPAYADPAAATDALVTRYHDMMLAPQVRGALVARMQQLVLQDPVPMLRGIRAPTLLLWGEKDAMIPVANAQDYQRAMPQARLVVLPAVGHVPHEEAAAAGLAAVQAFLAE